MSLVDWLAQCAAKSVVMEATGVYWVSLYELLERRGFKVYVVDAHTVRHLPGRSKSDVKDCQWLRRLHSYGLLQGCFRPPAQIRQLRNYLRSCSKIVEAAAQQQLRMQKALTLMNVHLHHVISDIGGLTGLSIVRAIVDGELIQNNWLDCAIRASGPARKPSRKAWRATGKRNCSSISRLPWRTTTTFNAKLRPTMSRSVKNSKRFHPKWIYSRNPCPQHG